MMLTTTPPTTIATRPTTITTSTAKRRRCANTNFATPILLLLLVLVEFVAVVSAEPRFGTEARSDGGDALFMEEKHNHQWCCTECTCVDSCDYFTPSLPRDQYIFLPSESPPTSNTLWNGNTIWDVYINRDGVGEQFCEAMFGYTCLKSASVVKDPHFQLWNGVWYDYHGECDLMYLRAPNFGKGIGLEVHIRTKIRHGYSFIETAAMKIGDDILEVSSWGEYWFNGVESADLTEAHLGPFDLVYQSRNEYQHSFDIKTESDQVVQIRTFKDFVDVKLDRVNMDDFRASEGMMGLYPSGNMTARDGVTVVEDPNHFAQEWQVREEEQSLFTLTSRHPQHPMQCVLPSETVSSEHRRLGETKISREEAEKACAHVGDSEQREMCIFDVMATGDLDMAEAAY